MSKQLLKSSIGRILMLSLPLFILILAIFLLAKVQERIPEMITSRGVPSPIPSPEVFPPSRWATNSGVLEIEKNLKTISHDLEIVDLKESNLIPPVLDLEIKF